MIKYLIHQLKLGAREQIEQLQPYTRVKRNQRFILRVDTRDMRRQLFEQGNRCWLIVYEDPALGGYFATENQACVVGVHSVVFKDFGDGFFSFRFDFEYGGDDRALGPEADHIRRSLAAEE